MDWKQAVGTVLLGNLIVLVPMLLNAHAGAKYGIPFPVFIRAPFGVRGANLPAILRAIVACGWFGIQSWIGGTAIHSMLAIVCRPSQRTTACCGLASSASGCSIWSCVARRRVHPTSPGLRCALHVCHGGGAAHLGAHQGGQLCSMLSTPSSFHSTGEFSACSFRRSPPWLATGPRSRSTFPTSPATQNRRRRRPGDRRLDCL